MGGKKKSSKKKSSNRASGTKSNAQAVTVSNSSSGSKAQEKGNGDDTSAQQQVSAHNQKSGPVETTTPRASVGSQQNHVPEQVSEKDKPVVSAVDSHASHASEAGHTERPQPTAKLPSHETQVDTDRKVDGEEGLHRKDTADEISGSSAPRGAPQTSSVSEKSSPKAPATATAVQNVGETTSMDKDSQRETNAPDRPGESAAPAAAAPTVRAADPQGGPDRLKLDASGAQEPSLREDRKGSQASPTEPEASQKAVDAQSDDPTSSLKQQESVSIQAGSSFMQQVSEQTMTDKVAMHGKQTQTSVPAKESEVQTEVRMTSAGVQTVESSLTPEMEEEEEEEEDVSEEEVLMDMRTRRISWWTGASPDGQKSENISPPGEPRSASLFGHPLKSFRSNSARSEGSRYSLSALYTPTASVQPAHKVSDDSTVNGRAAAPEPVKTESTETQTEPVSAPATKDSQTQTDKVETERMPGPNTGNESESRTEAKTETQIGPEPEPRHEPEPKHKPEPEPETEPETEPKTEPKAEPKAEPRAEPKAGPETAETQQDEAAAKDSQTKRKSGAASAFAKDRASSTKASSVSKKVSFSTVEEEEEDVSDESVIVDFAPAGAAMKDSELRKILDLLALEDTAETDLDALMEMETTARSALVRQKELTEAVSAKDDIIETLREQLEDSTQKYESMSNRASRLESELRDQSKALTDMQKQLKDSAVELSNLKRGALISRDEYSALQQTMKNKQGKAQELERDVEVKEALLKSMRLDLSMVKKQNDELGTTLSARESEKARLQSELARDRAELKRLNQVVSEFEALKATLEDRLRQQSSKETAVGDEAARRAANAKIVALERQLKLARAAPAEAAPVARRPRRLSPDGASPPPLDRLSWSLEELETLSRLREQERGLPSDAAGPPDLRGSLERMCRQVFGEGDLDSYLAAVERLHATNILEKLDIPALELACRTINPLDWQRIYLLVLRSINSIETRRRESDSDNAHWYLQPWYSAMCEDLEKSGESGFKDWMAHAWSLGFRNVLLLGTSGDQLAKEVSKNGFRVAHEGRPLSRVSADGEWARRAEAGDAAASAALFRRGPEVHEARPSWTKVQPKGQFWSANGPSWVELNMSTFVGWQCALEALVEELNFGVRGKFVDLGEMRFGTISRRGSAAQCAAAARIVTTVTREAGAVTLADVPWEVSIDSGLWSGLEHHFLLVSRQLQVGIVDTVLGSDAAALKAYGARVGRSRVKWVTPFELPFAAPVSCLSAADLQSQLAQSADGKVFAPIVDGSVAERQCALFMSMTIGGVPVVQLGCELEKRDRKAAEERARRRGMALGIEDSEDLRDLFHIDRYSAQMEANPQLSQILTGLNEVSREAHSASDISSFVPVGTENAGVFCYVRVAVQSDSSSPIVGVVNTSRRQVSESIGSSDVLVKLRVPQGAFKIEHIVPPPEGSRFDGYFGELDMDLPPMSYALFRLKSVQGARSAVPRQPRTSTGSTMATVVPVILEWRHGGSSAVITGSFAGWNTVIPLYPVKTQPNRHVSLHFLRRGRYEAKFIVDGRWQCSTDLRMTNNKLSPTDPNVNNVLNVDRPAPEEEINTLHNHLMKVARTRQVPSGPGGMAVLCPAVIVWTKEASDVLLTTSADDWQQVYPLFKHELGNYHWIVVNFVAGAHFYRFCVDGQWTVAEEHPIQNDDKGIRSNVINVR
mmetsp:Transcript_1105/g.3424  ORF Transcript_1105/g.3424 Transcript_1105/m.3424 type:complete len:1693 (-) Transcript_1105:518-5596(-)